jgi:Asp-tRNA(Asn)/Glu-tRNA(Gln) amidotransferase A subunit family amidase
VTNKGGSPHYLSIREAARRIREGSLTATELVRACLTRCSRLEARILAWEHLDAGRAVERAEELDAARKAGKSAGVLHGIPLGIKDIVDVAGMPTTMGSPVHAGRMARDTATAVQQLEWAGAVILGKTVTSEFAYYTPRKTCNPWNPAHTPGGSSMGSAAAVAAGMVCGALGSQTNGSVVRPAAFCGVVGFKPSHGVISTGGVMPFAPTLDTIGVFARSVSDAALLAAGCAPAGRLPAECAPPSRPPRLAAVRSPVWDAASDAQKTMFADNVAALRRAGASVSEAELPEAFGDAHAVQRTIMAYEAAQHLGPVQRGHRPQLSARLNAFLDEGAAVGETRYRGALGTRDRLRQGYERFLSAYDGLVTPPATGEAPADLTQTGDPTFCTIWTLLGAPAVAVPVGLGPQGLPLGLQIVGAFRRDDAALAAAAWCERVFPFAGLRD